MHEASDRVISDINLSVRSTQTLQGTYLPLEISEKYALTFPHGFWL